MALSAVRENDLGVIAAEGDEKADLLRTSSAQCAGSQTIIMVHTISGDTMVFFKVCRRTAHQPREGSKSSGSSQEGRGNYSDEPPMQT